MLLRTIRLLLFYTRNSDFRIFSSASQTSSVLVVVIMGFSIGGGFSPGGVLLYNVEVTSCTAPFGCVGKQRSPLNGPEFE